MHRNQGNRGKDKENRRHGGRREGSSWHLTVKHVFLMIGLVRCIPVLRSLHCTKPGRNQGERRVRRSGVKAEKPEHLFRNKNIECLCFLKNYLPH